jgi:hypothetical protein
VARIRAAAAARTINPARTRRVRTSKSNRISSPGAAFPSRLSLLLVRVTMAGAFVTNEAGTIQLKKGIATVPVAAIGVPPMASTHGEAKPSGASSSRSVWSAGRQPALRRPRQRCEYSFRRARQQAFNERVGPQNFSTRSVWRSRAV